MKLLITGATGKVGSHFLPAFLASGRFAGAEVVAICHNRDLPPHDRLTVIKGSLSERATVVKAMTGVSHVVHMAAVKESPDLVIDVAVKGMFHLLEAFRASPSAKQFILIGGDCSVGHIFHRYDTPVTETSPRRAYPGCYALTKVIEEVMLEQYQIQYGINACCLRAPWIMEKDDFRYALSFGEEQFGGPPWGELLPQAEVARLSGQQVVPLMLDERGTPLKRNFVHVSDVVGAIMAAIDNPATNGELFNISMDEPVDYGRVAEYLKDTRGYSAIEIPTRFFSNWLDNAKARLWLGWRPVYELGPLIEDAWNYVRAQNDPRQIWYPG
ncbi:NAD(P)-dependent oxidoreductase [Nitratireductor mangrovi]|uniref:NAD(P)-dependent oxidoreductase n=1 Tax=Nitratireductor mangrovi TaxID=2599600 RepID=A0A5B8KXR9_9HYPH|nr:NAD(P)-dependent oxidoreductase [Nitratireductor mangrovi]QDZ00405.1 NAD(P)-dependent oxidoreductase [Nitratireductor mangrovi]